MKPSKLLYGGVGILAYLALSVLFFHIHPEGLLRGGEAPVTAAEAETSPHTTSLAGRRAGSDLPRLSGVEELLNQYSGQYFTVEPIEVIPTGVYELSRWEGDTAVVRRRRIFHERVTTNPLLGMTTYQQYYIVRFPDNTCALALFDQTMATKNADGTMVLPVGQLDSVRYAQAHLTQVGREYGVDTNSIIYAIDDKWFYQNGFQILMIRLGVTAAVVVVGCVLWGVGRSLLRKRRKASEGD